MPSGEESLFSLELVVEKIYIPHTTCRFPAIAFRLLDFPTILISHVESDLSTTIQNKISRDPYYRIPDQFSELKDAQGNFIVKKGKSCLFKISVETLKMHLTNTPLYVMVIDTFPDTPKLLGNSTVPLNCLMDNICVDVAKFGSTIPSVQGDKGLFKLYSLMGKEIGYFVLGFRLLCLGPGLIPHLPEGTLTKRLIQGEKENKVVLEAVNQGLSEHVGEHVQMVSSNRLNDTREMGSMTDVEMHDAILQTMNFHDKAVPVAISAPDGPRTKDNVTVSTQTERRKQQKQQDYNNKEFIEHVGEDDKEADITNNVVCPPPMFYNSKCNPKVKMQKQLHYDTSSLASDLIIEDFENEELSNRYPEKEWVTFDERIKPSLKHGKSLKKNLVDGWTPEDTNSKREVFPVLTALLNELTGIQSANFLEAVSKINHTQPSRPEFQIMKPKALSSGAATRRLEELSQPHRPLQKVDMKYKVSEGHEAKLIGETNQGSKNKTNQVKKNKGWLRQVPGQGVKKSPLAFGLTVTQRLRLAKTNPGWLKAVEEQKADYQKQKEMALVTPAVDSDVDLNVTNLSDTLTQVRRLAQKELEKGDHTLDTTAVRAGSEAGVNAKRGATGLKTGSPCKGKNWLQRYGRQSPSPKVRSKSPKSGFGKKKLGGVRQRQTPSTYKQRSHIDADEISHTSDQQSQKSIEVHVPSAQIDEEEDLSDITLDDRDAIPYDIQEDASKYQGFGRVEESFPESIDVRPNISLNETRNSDQPLESTRLSTNERFTANERLARHKESSDYDTNQFMSTDEPELQGLMTDEEDEKSDTHYSGRAGRLSGAVVSTLHKFPVVNPVASEQSPIPATRRSTLQLDVGPTRQLTPQPDTPRSQGSSKRPTPRPRGRPNRLTRESLNTDSVSSYQPSDPDNGLVSLSEANYSDDFHPAGSEFDDSLTDISSPEICPKLIPSTKLGYTIS